MKLFTVIEETATGRPAVACLGGLVAAGLLLIAAATAWTDDSPADAGKLLLTGKYEEAAEAYAQLAEKEPVGAAIGLARCRKALGKLRQAEKTLRDAAKSYPKAAELPAESGLLAFERGDYDAAEKLARAALALDENQLAARWLTAELHRTAGRLNEADAAYKWLVDYYNDAQRIDDPEAICRIGRAAAQYARWNRNADQFNFLVNRLYPSALRLDESYWPARLEAGLLFLEKFNQADAAAEFSAALAINPRAAEVHAARAALALQNYDLDRAGASIDRALEINPRLVRALQLRADLLMANFQTEEAAGVLEAARRLNPKSQETLGRLAAAYGAVDGLKDNPAGSRMGRLIDEATRRNPRCGPFFVALAESLDRLRKFPYAAEYYREAIERMPQLVGVRGQLGLVHMRLGEEEKAEKLLDQSFKIDPFNVRVKNTLAVLEVLADYDRLDTEHFTIKYDRRHDELLARYVARYLEDEVYPQTVARFGYEPEGKSLLEIFSRARHTSGHGWFSARMVGLPYVGTVAACGGKMVAMVSPGEAPEKFNWARVLRHEFVHVVSLQQTDFNIPHWYTEALAVSAEGYPRPQEWNDVLARRAGQGKTYDLETINLGFVRPASGEDWTLAYCQAVLYLEYMVERFGRQSPAKMLAAYADNLNTRAAIRRSLGVEQEELEKGYAEYLKKTVSSVDEASPEENALALLAGLKLRAEDYDEAARLYTLGAERFPHHDKWIKSLARVYLAAGNDERLAPVLAKLAERDGDDVLVRKKLAQLALAAKDFQTAADWANQALCIDVMDAEVHAMLARALVETGRHARAVEEYEVATGLVPRRPAWRLALAKACVKAGQKEKARAVLKELLELDPDYPGAEVLLKSL